MEFGADKNTAPWFFPIKDSGSGRLTARNGRIWAGGRNPGHSKTIGGAIKPVLEENNDRLNRLANSIADGLMGTFK